MNPALPKTYRGVGIARKSGVKRAVVLLSGGLDSATVLYLARKKGVSCFCLIFDYGQRHKREIKSAKRIAQSAKCPYKIIKLDFPWKGSSLLDSKIKIPGVTSHQSPVTSIPSTYVPGRNIVFLSLALSYAEAIGARAIYIGAHAQDYSGYPDCRPQFFSAFQKIVSAGTKSGSEGRPIKVLAPVLNKNKAAIIRLGESLGVPFKLTWSCYSGGRKPCGKCDSCYFRLKGFKEAGIEDPLSEK